MTSVSAKSETLCSLSFSDLLIGDGDTYVKGMLNHGGEGGTCFSPLVPLPDSLKAEVGQLRSLLDGEARDEFALLHDGVRYRVSRMQTVSGVWYAMRRAPKTVFTFAQLGIAKVIQERLCDGSLTHGLVLFSGAMASGKTSSASAMVAERLRRHGGYAVTLESPPEHPLQGGHGNGICLQNEVPPGDMGEAIVKVLRYAAPNIIFLGELRSPYEVSQALRAAINGHLVISTFHAKFLFVDNTRIGSAIRAKLRNTEIKNLGTEIQAQKNELLFERG